MPSEVRGRNHHRRHSTTTRRRARNMATKLLRFTVLSLVLAYALGAPEPGRIPKVYNALITSNQNLEPSKAYPVYQPVLHNAFPFPFQTVYYGEYPLTNSLLPAFPPKDPNVPESASAAPASPSSESPKEETATETPAPPAAEAGPEPKGPENATPAPPEPPKTESPIPLNEFGLPPQVLPIGRLGPSYDFTHFGPFPYAYPGFRLYDPYDPFGFNPYSSLPLYRPTISNVIGHGAPLYFGKEEVSTAAPATASQQETQTPPSEPSDLNVLNYSPKDPAIPNVPPPPLPSGGLKSDKSE